MYRQVDGGGKTAMSDRCGRGLCSDRRGSRRRRWPITTVPGHHPRGGSASQPRQEARQRHQLLISFRFFLLLFVASPDIVKVVRDRCDYVLLIHFQLQFLSWTRVSHILFGRDSRGTNSTENGYFTYFSVVRTAAIIVRVSTADSLLYRWSPRTSCRARGIVSLSKTRVFCMTLQLRF